MAKRRSLRWSPCQPVTDVCPAPCRGLSVNEQMEGRVNAGERTEDRETRGKIWTEDATRSCQVTRGELGLSQATTQPAGLPSSAHQAAKPSPTHPRHPDVNMLLLEAGVAGRNFCEMGNITRKPSRGGDPLKKLSATSDPCSTGNGS